MSNIPNISNEDVIEKLEDELGFDPLITTKQLDAIIDIIPEKIKRLTELKDELLTFETKMKAVECYSTQFHNPKSLEPETFISKPGFINYIKSRAEFYGFAIGKNYGEPFFCEEKIELDHLSIFKLI